LRVTDIHASSLKGKTTGESKETEKQSSYDGTKLETGKGRAKDRLKEVSRGAT